MKVRKMQARTVERSKAMLAAATDLFLEKGYERTSLTEVLDRSKGSRNTLYELFGNKEGLLRAMVEEAAARVWEAVNIDETVEGLTEDGLTRLGCRFVRAVTDSETVAVYRVVVSQGHRIPEIAELFMASGPTFHAQKMTELFRRGFDSGDLRVGTPEQMARMFFGIILGNLNLRQTTGLPPDWKEEEIEPYVRLAVRVFLTGTQGLDRN